MCLDPKRFSSWKRLKGVYAWVCRFVENCSPWKGKWRIESKWDWGRRSSLHCNCPTKSLSEKYSALLRKKELPKNSKLFALRPRLDEEWNTGLNDEELVTKSTGAEVLLNSRPLTYQSASHEDDAPSTPNHFLIGQDSGQFTPESVEETNYNY